MKTILFKSFLLIVFALGFVSCVDDIFLEGNGDLRTEYRAASGFEEISSSGDFKVTVKPGDDYSIEVSAESNLLSYIETDVVGSALKIRTRGVRSLRNNYPIEIFITTPALKGLSLSGSGYIKTGRFLSDEFKVAVSGSGDIDTEVETSHIKANISGSGNILLTGEATSSEFVISGSGKIKAFDLPHNTCEAVISGSGDMYVNANDAINARISGSGTVYYINYPVIHTSISGSGGVVNRN
jgi:hypothetical protein